MRGMTTRSAVLVTVLLASAACAGRSPGVSRDRKVITAEEIATVQVTTAYDVVTRLRGEFLRSRGTVTRTTGTRTATQAQPSITVFVDEVEQGPIERTLHLIPAAEVHEIRLYRAADAATKYGSRHNGGVIAVTTKRVRE
jgi:hypothetical protein